MGVLDGQRLSRPSLGPHLEGPPLHGGRSVRHRPIPSHVRHGPRRDPSGQAINSPRAQHPRAHRPSHRRRAAAPGPARPRHRDHADPTRSDTQPSDESNKRDADPGRSRRAGPAFLAERTDRTAAPLHLGAGPPRRGPSRQGAARRDSKRHRAGRHQRRLSGPAHLARRDSPAPGASLRWYRSRCVLLAKNTSTTTGCRP